MLPAYLKKLLWLEFKSDIVGLLHTLFHFCNKISSAELTKLSFGGVNERPGIFKLALEFVDDSVYVSQRQVSFPRNVCIYFTRCDCVTLTLSPGGPGGPSPPAVPCRSQHNEKNRKGISLDAFSQQHALWKKNLQGGPGAPSADHTFGPGFPVGPLAPLEPRGPWGGKRKTTLS